MEAKEICPQGCPNINTEIPEKAFCFGTYQDIAFKHELRCFTITSSVNGFHPIKYAVANAEYCTNKKGLISRLEAIKHYRSLSLESLF